MWFCRFCHTGRLCNFVLRQVLTLVPCGYHLWRSSSYCFSCAHVVFVNIFLSSISSKVDTWIIANQIVLLKSFFWLTVFGNLIIQCLLFSTFWKTLKRISGYCLLLKVGFIPWIFIILFKNTFPLYNFP